ncbi:hypothetical protein CDL12_27031 [Handroanthus impetiginosus]|uniref:Uncharacterized protein n=1 Tax=Handroanthus impetiginosus TaxID=429701 RepID=A0A2G9G570_9LAMI|nr:hypothetical protein CDL12_27031 [Handroanthus impetiginosus]
MSVLRTRYRDHKEEFDHFLQCIFPHKTSKFFLNCQHSEIMHSHFCEVKVKKLNAIQATQLHDKTIEPNCLCKIRIILIVINDLDNKCCFYRLKIFSILIPLSILKK